MSIALWGNSGEGYCPYGDVMREPEMSLSSTEPRLTVFKDGILKAMKELFGDDRRRIRHALAVLGYAEAISGVEGGDPYVIAATALLHDIGIPEAERKYGSSAGNYQEVEGPPIARKLLMELGTEERIIEEVCRIIASHHSPGEVDSVNFKVLYDADWLVNLPEEFPEADEGKLEAIIGKVFLTRSGRDMARNLYLRR